MSREACRRRVADALAMAGLKDLADRPARVLSGGEQQRLALARAWASEPQILFLDEPTASLDPAATRAIESLIETIHRAGVKIVMTTHDLGQARRLGDDIVFMHKGRILERGSADAFFEDPRTVEAAAFIKGELLW
jgi:tungstate transport system ATP-binding protein